MVREGFEGWMLEQLSGLAEITVRPLSGGQGIYWRSWMIERRSSPGLWGRSGRDR